MIKSCISNLLFYSTHGKSLYPSIIFTIITLDGNNVILVLAFAFVFTEDQNYWEWFLGDIRPHLLGLSESEIVIISNHDKELINVVKNMLLDTTHIYCCQYIGENIKYRYGIECCNLF